MRFLNKKGISPLIATVLIIGFTIALAAIVITWGSGFVNKVTGSTEQKTSNILACTSDLSFELGKVTCPNKVVVDNRGNVNIKSFAFRFFDASGGSLGVSSTNTPVGVNKYEVKEVAFGTNMPATTNKIEALATITVDGIDVTCGEAVKTKTFSPAC